MLNKAKIMWFIFDRLLIFIYKIPMERRYEWYKWKLHIFRMFLVSLEQISSPMSHVLWVCPSVLLATGYQLWRRISRWWWRRGGASLLWRRQIFYYFYLNDLKISVLRIQLLVLSSAAWLRVRRWCWRNRRKGSSLRSSSFWRSSLMIWKEILAILICLIRY